MARCKPQKSHISKRNQLGAALADFFSGTRVSLFQCKSIEMRPARLKTFMTVFLSIFVPKSSIWRSKFKPLGIVSASDGTWVTPGLPFGDRGRFFVDVGVIWGVPFGGD